MGAYMEEVLKNKFKRFGDQGEASKLFSICSISKDYSRKQLEGENWLTVGESNLPPMVALPLSLLLVFNQGFNGYFKSLSYRLAMETVSYWIVEIKILNGGSSRKGGDQWEGLEFKLQSKVDLYQIAIRLNLQFKVL
ncbi:hypothetical protein M9H77_30085 [Catharanthus roseus]|uniref:Uncharacterized protein n=1 Tax=Catharanthus roseus TaxID=4058 RepID=A0ACC0A0I0_CATRO|nr:hypothetical protein M9H77_30085 [Catharanthus roseus]